MILNIIIKIVYFIYYFKANSGKDFRRDIKTDRTYIANPRLNLCLNGHPFNFIEAFKQERYAKDDGLVHRFFVCCPKPSSFTSKDIMSTEKNPCSLLLIFYYIKIRNSNDKGFSQMELSPDAETIFNKYFDIFFDLGNQCYQLSTYIKAILGKASTHLLILAGILQAFDEGFHYVNNISEEKFSLNQKFKEDLIKNLSLIENKITISEDNIKRAYRLLEYFDKNKLILSGYEHEDWSLPLSEIIKGILSQIKNMKKDSSNSCNALKTLSLINKKILLSEKKDHKVNELNQSFKHIEYVDKDFIQNIFDSLVQFKFGLKKVFPNARGPKSYYFSKFYIENLSEEQKKYLNIKNISISKFLNSNSKLGNC